ncbi:hypothetical protein TNCV_2515731 [Trichonephila clavipes]|nr:hypothetical protein TNCV_2515731 [Trichonephila clavipes]
MDIFGALSARKNLHSISHLLQGLKIGPMATRRAFNNSEYLKSPSPPKNDATKHKNDRYAREVDQLEVTRCLKMGVKLYPEEMVL